MSPRKLNKRIILDRLSWIDRMLEQIRSLPDTSYEEFVSDSRNIWTADSCLRRALEALFDIGRHILSKGFANGTSEYKQIAENLGSNKILDEDETRLLRTLAGYRNRLVHFYHEVSNEELYQICTDQLDDIRKLRRAFAAWMDDHPELLDEEL